MDDVVETPERTAAGTGPREGRNSYRVAIETGDFELLRDAFAEHARIFIPPQFEAVEGRDTIVAFLGKIVSVFGHGGDFRFTHELDDAEGHKALVFAATVPGKGEHPPVDFTTTDLFTFGEDDRITEMVAMTRPIQALLLLREHGIGAVSQGPREGKNSYRVAIETKDFDLLREAFAEDAEILVPSQIEPFEDVDQAVGFLRQLHALFDAGGESGFTIELDDAKGSKALVLKGTIPGKGDLPAVEFEATTLLEFDEGDRIKKMIAMTRPIQGLLLLREHATA